MVNHMGLFGNSVPSNDHSHIKRAIRCAWQRAVLTTCGWDTNGWPPLALRLVMRDEKFDQRLHIGGPDAEGLRAILLVDAHAYSFPNRFKRMVIPHQ
jgi:hypothetical protein